MEYSQATNHALHTMLYFVAIPIESIIGVQHLAEQQMEDYLKERKLIELLNQAGDIISHV